MRGVHRSIESRTRSTLDTTVVSPRVAVAPPPAMPTRTLAAPNGLILKHKHSLHRAGLWRTQTALHVVVVRICPYADRTGRRSKRAAIFGVIEGHSGPMQAAPAGNL